MEDQERIKNIIATAKREVIITKTKSANFLPHVLMPVNYVECFIQQAEEKQELEERFEHLSEQHDLALEQNKRYEEALEEIAKEVHLDGDSKLATQKKLIKAIISARQALQNK
ncbi:hypothetical protein Pryu01_03023 [Paraliobacillus ryukyuensis]|uniref:Uncharacterized protein n=1 Tax=Paraliobacillus ryukyuensis TaxID=200904 RepID=A0A366DQ63_9BACI|nr:hypothetical protein [Paraliobacillus ryukyuensis]RBO92045.1 hypothetical protein DES48_1179 [Paraliobacillus ryukyuensis]